MFQLTDDEWDNLRCKNFTSTHGGTRYLPYAFTEQGIYMLMTVLKGELAIKQSRALILTFKQMKDYISKNRQPLINTILENLTKQTESNTQAIAEIKESMVSKADLPEIIRSFGFSKAQTEYLILNGETVEAGMAYKNIYAQARKSIFIVDNYIGLKTLHLLKDVSPTVDITIFSDNLRPGLSQQEYNDFYREYSIYVDFKKTAGMVHDRYIVLDYSQPDEKIFHCGASSKDAGNRVTTISLMSDNSVYHPLINSLLNNQTLLL